MQDYRKLHVWQKAHQLALKTYEVPSYLQKPEAWPLRDQILRAAISIPSNIAEGTVVGLTLIFVASCGIRWAHAMNWSHSSCSQPISSSSRVQFIPGSRTRYPKCEGCWLVSFKR